MAENLDQNESVLRHTILEYGAFHSHLLDFYKTRRFRLATGKAVRGRVMWNRLESMQPVVQWLLSQRRFN